MKTSKMFRACLFVLAFITLQVTKTQGRINFPLDLPEDCRSQECAAQVCYDGRRMCNEYPAATCKGYCNNCIARYFVGSYHVTPLCGNSPEELLSSNF